MIDAHALNDDIRSWTNRQLIAGYIASGASSIEHAAKLLLVSEAASRDPWTFCLEANEVYSKAFIRPYEDRILKHAGKPIGEVILRGPALLRQARGIPSPDIVLNALAALQHVIGLTPREVLLHIS